MWEFGAPFGAETVRHGDRDGRSEFRTFRYNRLLPGCYIRSSPQCGFVGWNEPRCVLASILPPLTPSQSV